MANPTFKPMEIELHSLGGFRTIASALDAAEALLEYWSANKQHGVEFELACIACVEAVDHGGSGEAVREALVHAARAADCVDDEGLYDRRGMRSRSVRFVIRGSRVRTHPAGGTIQNQ